VVDSGVALSQPDFWDFTNAVNGTPHGAVHIAVGGNMTQFATAGQDPIFWLHHSNIDRLWDVWLESGGGHVDPTTDTTWMTTPFNFYDESGATVTLTGAQVVDIACQLHYQYESDVCGRIYVIDPGWWRRYTRLPVVPAPLLASLDSLVRRPPLPDPAPLGQQPGPVRLGGRPVQITIPVSPEAKAALRNLTTPSGTAGHLNLVLGDIRIEGRPRVVYEMYLNLPADARNADYASPNFVGMVNLFGPGADTAHARPEDQIVPLTLAMLRLRANKTWSDDTVRVTFIPRGVTEGADPAKALGASTPVTIGRVALQLR
jgi:tyrosinase